MSVAAGRHLHTLSGDKAASEGRTSPAICSTVGRARPTYRAPYSRRWTRTTAGSTQLTFRGALSEQTGRWCVCAATTSATANSRRVCRYLTQQSIWSISGRSLVDRCLASNIDCCVQSCQTAELTQVAAVPNRSTVASNICKAWVAVAEVAAAQPRPAESSRLRFTARCWIHTRPTSRTPHGCHKSTMLHSTPPSTPPAGSR